MPDLATVVAQILEALRIVPVRRSVLVAISGIDGCGKGYVTARLVEAFQAKSLRVAGINIDGWLNLPARRFSDHRPAAHFYQHAIRFADMFSQLIQPVREQRSLRLKADFAEEMATTFRRQIYEFENIDVIVLGSIYLLKREFQQWYDLSYWIDCSQETARERAIVRAQEGLSPEATICAFRKIYFPAQEIHFQRDDPRTAATSILINDQRLSPVGEKR